MSEYFKEVQNMLEQAKELVKTLENKYNELNKPKNVRWRAEEGALWYRACTLPEGASSEDFSEFCNYYYSIGNYFKTSEEAEKHKNYLIITQKLKDIALRLNDGVEIDWNSKVQCKFYIGFQHSGIKQGELLKDINKHFQSVGAIYCLSNKFLETCIKEIGEKELIEYIKLS